MQNQAHVDSWYAASVAPLEDFPRLQGEVSADVCIIGGGYTGLSTAIFLRQRGYSVALLEANRVGWGASGRNGGHVGTGQRADQEQLEKMLGPDHAKALWDLGLEAVDTVCELIDDNAIDCELKRGNLHVACKAKEAPELEAEVEHLSSVYGGADLGPGLSRRHPGQRCPSPPPAQVRPGPGPRRGEFRGADLRRQPGAVLQRG
jgi:gamma-glutamylputrescine oxidase